MNLLVVDLDDTLINTQEFKKQLFFNIAKAFSLDEHSILAIYNKRQDSAGVRSFYTGFYTDLIEAFSLSPQLLDTVISQTITQIPLNQPVMDFVKSSSSHKLLLSYGDERLQKQKIEELNIAELFNEVIVTDQDKLTTLEEYLKGHSYEHITVIDDRDRFLNQVHQAFPDIEILDVCSIH